VAVSGPSGWTVKDSLSGRVIERGLGDLAMTLRGGRLVLNGRPIGVTSCLVASDGGTLTVDGQRYRGRIQVLAKPPGLMVVNELSIEDYLYGVVPREMSWLWHPEALMAQAVASRTYALYIRDKQRLAGSDYDLEATTASQVYGGLDAEKEQTRQAVDRTRGRVLTYQGKLIIAYFHATSGGSTESALNVWGVDIPYLKGVSDEFSSLLPDHVWEHRVSLAEMTKLFRSIVPGLGPIRDIRAGKTSPSGRILSFTLVWDGGHKVLPGNLFRLTLGPTLLKSTRFDMVSKNGFVIFKGTGYGHGVGMSQWGAHRMAQAGYSCEAILAHYYTGVSLMQVGYR
jgi:stage II sporulation protein D